MIFPLNAINYTIELKNAIRFQNATQQLTLINSKLNHYKNEILRNHNNTHVKKLKYYKHSYNKKVIFLFIVNTITKN